MSSEPWLMRQASKQARNRPPLPCDEPLADEVIEEAEKDDLKTFLHSMRPAWQEQRRRWRSMLEVQTDLERDLEPLERMYYLNGFTLMRSVLTMGARLSRGGVPLDASSASSSSSSSPPSPSQQPAPPQAAQPSQQDSQPSQSSNVADPATAPTAQIPFSQAYTLATPPSPFSPSPSPAPPQPPLFVSLSRGSSGLDPDTAHDFSQQSASLFDATWHVFERPSGGSGNDERFALQFPNPKGIIELHTEMRHGKATAGIRNVGGMKQHAVWNSILSLLARATRIAILGRDGLACDKESLHFILSHTRADTIFGYDDGFGEAIWQCYPVKLDLAMLNGTITPYGVSLELSASATQGASCWASRPPSSTSRSGTNASADSSAPARGSFDTNTPLNTTPSHPDITAWLGS